MADIDIESMVAPASAEPLKPIPTPVDQVADFPHSDEVPEGCVVIEDDFADTFFFSTYITEEKYVTRETKEGHLDLKLTIYTPFHDDPNMPDGNHENGWPVIVFMRGAAFFKPNPASFNSLYTRLSEKGYAVVVPEYRPSTVAPFPAQMQDCKTAIRYVRRNAERLGFDPGRIALFGGRPYRAGGRLHRRCCA